MFILQKEKKDREPFRKAKKSPRPSLSPPKACACGNRLHPPELPRGVRPQPAPNGPAALPINPFSPFFQPAARPRAFLPFAPAPLLPRQPRRNAPHEIHFPATNKDSIRSKFFKDERRSLRREKGTFSKGPLSPNTSTSTAARPRGCGPCPARGSTRLRA